MTDTYRDLHELVMIIPPVSHLLPPGTRFVVQVQVLERGVALARLPPQVRMEALRARLSGDRDELPRNDLAPVLDMSFETGCRV